MNRDELDMIVNMTINFVCYGDLKRLVLIRLLKN